jgi:hypothetical protein
MSGLDVYTTQEAISAYVRSQFPNYEVYDDVVLDDDFVVKQGNSVNPYIVLQYGSLRRSPTNGSFAGVRFDEYYSTVDISVVAPKPSQARRSSNVIVDKLIGYKPTGSSPMVPEGGSVFWAASDNSGRPYVYVANFRLSYAINSSDAGAYITP